MLNQSKKRNPTTIQIIFIPFDSISVVGDGWQKPHLPIAAARDTNARFVEEGLERLKFEDPRPQLTPAHLSSRPSSPLLISFVRTRIHSMMHPCMVITQRRSKGENRATLGGANSLNLCRIESKAGSYWFTRHCLWCGRLRQLVRELFWCFITSPLLSSPVNIRNIWLPSCSLALPKLFPGFSGPNPFSFSHYGGLPPAPSMVPHSCCPLRFHAATPSPHVDSIHSVPGGQPTDQQYSK